MDRVSETTRDQLAMTRASEDRHARSRENHDQPPGDAPGSRLDHSRFRGRDRERRQRDRSEGGGLSQEAIVRAAIELMDEVGIEGLSMRRVAAMLGVGVMSLYWYVARKENLLGLVAEEIFTELDLPSQPSDDWKADLRLVGMRTWDVFVRHPWIMGTMDQPQHIVGDAFMRHIEFSYGALMDLGVEPKLMLSIVSTVDQYVFGAGLLNARAQALARNGDEQRHDMGNQLRNLIDTGRYPYTEQLVAQYPGFTDDDYHEGEMDALFAFGLDALLDGLEERLRDAGYLKG